MEEMVDGIEVFQNLWEMKQAVIMAGLQRHHSALEIGVWDGGTLREWIRLFENVVAVDSSPRKQGLWEQWAASCSVQLTMVAGDSTHPDTISSVRRRAPYDWIFIDAEHGYEGVKADWDNYRPMLAVDGAVAFHDILPRPDYGVSRLWREITAEQGARWMEIVQTTNEYGGIGIIWPA